MSRPGVLSELLENFLTIVPDVIAINLTGPDGEIFAHIENRDVDASLQALVPGAIKPLIAKLQDHFSFQKFGTASFESDDFRLLFVDTSRDFILNIVLDLYANIDRTFPYAYILAEKVAQIQEGREIQITMPQLGVVEQPEVPRLKNLFYPVQFREGSYKYKFLLLGDAAVGKTSLIIRFVEGQFKGDYRATIGLNILTHHFKPSANANVEITYMFWDIGSQEYFKRVRRTYFEGADVVFIVFDLTRPETLENVKLWKAELDANLKKPAGGALSCPVMLLGNKNDVEANRVVNPEEATAIAAEIGAIAYLETSAKTGESVNDAFALMAYRLLESEITESERNIRLELAVDFDSLHDRVTGLPIKIAIVGKDPFWNPYLHFFQTFTNATGPLVAHTKRPYGNEYTFANSLIVKNLIVEDVLATESEEVEGVEDLEKQLTPHLETLGGCHGVVLLAEARDWIAPGAPLTPGTARSLDSPGALLARAVIRHMAPNGSVAIGILTETAQHWLDIQERITTILEDLQFDRAFLFRISRDYRPQVLDSLKTLFNTIH